MSRKESRPWEELRAIGNERAAGRITRAQAVDEAIRYFEVPRSPEEEAVNVFLGGMQRRSRK
jgi:hypothetical protein